jgi:hypothetical protein
MEDIQRVFLLDFWRVAEAFAGESPEMFAHVQKEFKKRLILELAVTDASRTEATGFRVLSMVLTQVPIGVAPALKAYTRQYMLRERQHPLQRLPPPPRPPSPEVPVHDGGGGGGDDDEDSPSPSPSPSSSLDLPSPSPSSSSSVSIPPPASFGFSRGSGTASVPWHWDEEEDSRARAEEESQARRARWEAAEDAMQQELKRQREEERMEAMEQRRQQRRRQRQRQRSASPVARPRLPPPPPTAAVAGGDAFTSHAAFQTQLWRHDPNLMRNLAVQPMGRMQWLPHSPFMDRIAELSRGSYK